jgi:hypothetical protein
MNAAGEIVGITPINAKWLSERPEGLSITLPIDAEQLAPAFA